jgi:5-methyltetrahydropteroyltriglutamate--homocysteine methyltransferase
VRNSKDGILTTHAGSLSRPAALIELYASEAPGEELDASLRSAVEEVVQKQVQAGIAVVNDGEYGKPMRQAVDFGAWGQYFYDRVSGFETRPLDRPFGWNRGKDRAQFQDFYQEYTASMARRFTRVCVGPIVYDDTLVRRDIANLRAALEGKGATEAFLPVAWPNDILDDLAANECYASMEEYWQALADAMKQEYRVIAESGLVLQIDDPGSPAMYDWRFAERPIEEYRKWAQARVELLNYALTGIPREQVRYHICWGSWHGPHSTDLPLKDYFDIMMTVNAQAFSVEAGNVRHEHEWKVWLDSKVPEGTIAIPGVVSHATNVLEHPELVADRIARYAEAVGRENVIAGTDCGLGGRIHPQLAWAKLRVLSEGAALATKRLWER